MKIYDEKPAVKGKLTAGIDPRILSAAEAAEAEAAPLFGEIERTARANGEKVLDAFVNNKMSSACLLPTFGYGYDDLGRDTLDRVFAEIVGAEDAIIRHNFVSGTHAISTALFGVLRPGDKMVSVTGAPYDTLKGVIGAAPAGRSRESISGAKDTYAGAHRIGGGYEGGGAKNTAGSLCDFGIIYDEVPLLTAAGTPNFSEIFTRVKGAKVAYIQRSKGYALRPALTVADIAEIVKTVKNAEPEIIVIVDNCYGEFVENIEPTNVGADLIIGSLIKNPGGGIAQTGGYIAGKTALVNLCADRLSAIGIGREAGASLYETKRIAQGLYFAPEVTAAALKTAAFIQCIMPHFGLSVLPEAGKKRGDIVTAIKMPDAESLIHFCKGIQKGSPIDSFVSPEPWDMPGYDCKIIMASGGFNLGSSIELSADAPIREPYVAYVQGGITYTAGRIGVLTALREMFDNHCLRFV
jgi:cystathionine beta-lyase family protein involved in aluminum resistance